MAPEEWALWTVRLLIPFLVLIHSAFRLIRRSVEFPNSSSPSSCNDDDVSTISESGSGPSTALISGNNGNSSNAGLVTPRRVTIAAPDHDTPPHVKSKELNIRARDAIKALCPANLAGLEQIYRELDNSGAEIAPETFRALVDAGLAAARWCDQAVEVTTTPSNTNKVKFPKDRRDSPRSCSPTASTRVGTPKTEASPGPVGTNNNTIHELLALVGTQQQEEQQQQGTAGTTTTTGTAAETAAYAAYAAAAGLFYPPLPPRALDWQQQCQAQWAAASQYYWTLPSVDVDVKSSSGASTGGQSTVSAVYQ